VTLPLQTTEPATTGANARPLRVTFVLSSLQLSGGVRAIVEYANRLVASGHHVTLVAPRAVVDPAVAAAIGSAVCVRESALARGGSSLLHHVRLTLSLARAVPPSDVVVSTHTPTTVAGGVAAHLLKRGRAAWLFMDYAEMFAGRPVEAWLMRHALCWHAAAWTISQASADELRQYTPGAAGRVCPVGLGLHNAALLTPLAWDERPENLRRTLLYVGDGRPRKGLADFLAAAEFVHRAVPETKLWIVCKDPCQVATSVPHEVFVRPTDEELARLYRSCGVFVSSSWSEGLGWPPLEAMACAAPVVLTDSRGPREFARHEENCLMTPPRNPAALADAILRTLHDDALAARLSRNGPPTAAAFQWDAVMDRLEQFLLRLVS
jgi:glycosyltransferase involved in cell wall biosynthesis